MFTTHLPRLHSHFSIFARTHSLCTQQLFFIARPRLSTAAAISSAAKTNPISHFSATPTLPTLSTKTPLLNPEIASPEEETQLEIPIDKLFVPPETEVLPGNIPRILKGSNIVLSKYARDAQVVQADYVKSSVTTEDCPSDGLPEFALVGRSNVGKSSLLNSLVRRKKLALTSKKPVRLRYTPVWDKSRIICSLGVLLRKFRVWKRHQRHYNKETGKTQCINHFIVNDSWYLVDLPGYGFAAAPHDLRTDWDKFTKDYFLNRKTLVSVFLLVDASIPAKTIDLEYASWLGQNQVPMTLIFTKCDKRKKKKNGGKRPEENVKDFQELISAFFKTVPPWIMTSSVTNQGRDEILLHMAQLRNYWLKH